MKSLVAGHPRRGVKKQDFVPDGVLTDSHRGGQAVLQSPPRPRPFALVPPPSNPDPAIANIANELEDAGWLGLTAAAALGTFLLDGKPGALAATESGVVWTKTINSGEEGQAFPFGIGKLKINGGAVTAALGINWEDDKPAQISLLISFLSGNALTLEVDRKYTIQADRKERDLPFGGKELIGYATQSPAQQPRSGPDTSC